MPQSLRAEVLRCDRCDAQVGRLECVCVQLCVRAKNKQVCHTNFSNTKRKITENQDRLMAEFTICLRVLLRKSRNQSSNQATDTATEWRPTNHQPNDDQRRSTTNDQPVNQRSCIACHWRTCFTQPTPVGLPPPLRHPARVKIQQFTRRCLADCWCVPNWLCPESAWPRDRPSSVQCQVQARAVPPQRLTALPRLPRNPPLCRNRAMLRPRRQQRPRLLGNTL
jgi:hypothetical protein